ncbi:uncharacterized protein FIBRA_04691 [Fibroporia radiculosa]|uniref:Dienelactone hydrolase domain-containing protein n=1 Tax=Fibroporia radiculosa TaxID=599839 RepID=J4G7S8_9APHY|nr:uncharacterized protein FIBRA_04691 [Fibroporia radiculosa]CCM02588.1 predicted protein [Fibroporia radiculosa]
MSLCEHCTKGVRHEGTPEGHIEDIGGVECYVATPADDHAKDKVVLYFTDILGHRFLNHHLMADDFAQNGFWVVIPDILNNDGVTPDVLDGGKLDIPAWLARHGQETVKPILENVMAALRDSGVERFAAIGFCFGARPAIDLAFSNNISVCIVSHPSLWKMPDDMEASEIGSYMHANYRAMSKAPLLLNTAEIDTAFPKEQQAQADEVLGGGNFEPGYERTYWEGCAHGFAVRGSLDNPRIRVGKEGAFKASVLFLKKHF